MKSPKRRVQPGFAAREGYFFPGEVARALTIEHIDYHQLRFFYKLIRDQAGLEVPPGWSRFTFTDLACLLVALDVCGGAEALAPQRRLVSTNLQKACAALRLQGYPNPLLNVALVRRGRQFFAAIDGLVLDPLTGQLLIESASRTVDEYFSGALLTDPALVSALRSEVRRHRNRRV